MKISTEVQLKIAIKIHIKIKNPKKEINKIGCSIFQTIDMCYRI